MPYNYLFRSYNELLLYINTCLFLLDKLYFVKARTQSRTQPQLTQFLYKLLPLFLIRKLKIHRCKTTLFDHLCITPPKQIIFYNPTNQ